MTDFKNVLHRQLYAQSWAKWQAEVRRAIAHDKLEAAWPSSSEGGGRQGVSPLGGVAKPAAEIEKENG
jgi:hypothetical protein